MPLFGALHPLFTIPAAFLFGGLLVGGNSLQRAVQVPSALILALNGLVVVFVIATDRYRKNLREEQPVADDEDSDPSAPVPTEPARSANPGDGGIGP